MLFLPPRQAVRRLSSVSGAYDTSAILRGTSGAGNDGAEVRRSGASSPASTASTKGRSSRSAAAADAGMGLA